LSARHVLRRVSFVRASEIRFAAATHDECTARALGAGRCACGAFDEAVLVLAAVVRAGLGRVLVDRAAVSLAAVVVVAVAVCGATVVVALEAPPQPASPTISSDAVDAALADLPPMRILSLAWTRQDGGDRNSGESGAGDQRAFSPSGCDARPAPATAPAPEAR
jgi:hypothetical protein